MKRKIHCRQKKCHICKTSTWRPMEWNGVLYVAQVLHSEGEVTKGSLTDCIGKK